MIQGPEDEVKVSGRASCLRCRRASQAEAAARYRNHQPQELYVSHLQRNNARRRAQADAIAEARLEELRAPS